MIYQHPLAYLLGLEGLALLRGWAGDFDKEFVLARLAEVRRLVEDETLANHPGIDIARANTTTGYRTWASTYDEPNTLFLADEPVMHEIIDALPIGTALDAACGTGRYAAHLAGLGHQVIGVDSSPEMLDVARAKLPEADFRAGVLEDLPVEDESVDLVVSGLALAHVPDLVPVMAQLARVLRPGGHLVISDAHHELVFRGSVVKAIGPAGEPGLVNTYRHTPGDFLRAALPAGLQVRRCEEPKVPARDERAEGPDAIPTSAIGAWEDGWPWTLLGVVPEATVAAWSTPSTIIWHFQRSDG